MKNKNRRGTLGIIKTAKRSRIEEEKRGRKKREDGRKGKCGKHGYCRLPRQWGKEWSKMFVDVRKERRGEEGTNLGRRGRWEEIRRKRIRRGSFPFSFFAWVALAHFVSVG